MKKNSFIMFCCVLLQIVLCQCTSSYRVVDFKEYTKGKLWVHSSYKYEDGKLVSKAHENLLAGSRDLTKYDYDVRTSDIGVDSIETRYYCYNDTVVTVRSYNTDGILQHIRHYSYKGEDGIQETSHKYYDSKGRLVRDSSHVSQDYTYYDSLDRYVGWSQIYKKKDYNSPLPKKGEPIVENVIIEWTGDTVLYSWDGKYTTKTVIRWKRPDSIWTVTSKTVYEPDEKGRIVSDSASDKKQTMEYVFDSKGRMRRMYIFDDCPDDVDSIEYFISRTECKYDTKGRPVWAVKRALEYPNNILQKQVWRYHRGHRTKIIYFRYDNGRKRLNFVTTYKYGLFNGKLEKESEYNNRLRLNPVSKYVRKYKRIPLRQSVPQQPA